MRRGCDTTGTARRSARVRIDQREAFLPRRFGEALVERDNSQRWGTAVRGYESRRELQGVGRSQRVYAEKSHGVFANDLGGLDLVPAIGKLLQPVGGERHPLPVERARAFEARQSRDAF